MFRVDFLLTQRGRRCGQKMWAKLPFNRISFRRQRFRQTLDKLPYLITDPAINIQRFVFRCRRLGQSGRVIEPNVDHFGLAGKNGAVFVCMAADGHDVVERNVLDHVNVL